MDCIICGSRTGFMLDQIILKMDEVQEKAQEKIIRVVSGTAKGVDTMGETWAQARGLRISRFPADWNTFGKRAGHIRNAEMQKFAEALVAFWDGSSPGTYDMIKQMQKAGKPVIVYNLNLKRIKVT